MLISVLVPIAWFVASNLVYGMEWSPNVISAVCSIVAVLGGINSAIGVFSARRLGKALVGPVLVAPIVGPLAGFYVIAILRRLFSQDRDFEFLLFLWQVSETGIASYLMTALGIWLAGRVGQRIGIWNRARTETEPAELVGTAHLTNETSDA
jgi:uncharacterized membrane protein YuzA (DUF378 family)